MLEASRVLKSINDWIKRTVSVMRCALIPDSYMWFIGNAIEPRLAEARLTYTSLAANKDNLTVAALDPLPAARLLLQFRLPPHKLCML